MVEFVFISQPMRDKTNEEIYNERREVVEKLENPYKLKIISDGTPVGTKVFIGNKAITDFNFIERIQIDITNEELNEVIITFRDVDLDLEIPGDKIKLKEVLPEQEES